jgi:hypothetical protein
MAQDFVHRQSFNHWQHAATHRLRELHEAPTAADRHRAAGPATAGEPAMALPPPLPQDGPARFLEARLQGPAEALPSL